ncbi:hypothetical protein FRB99_008526 [Tulasnella sp. 403]|nr:hypothetical protein FRB99_008526 [Tulasnella sp. 403]
MATEEKTANPPGSLDTERGAPTTDVKSPTNAEKTPYVTPKSSPEDVPFSVFTQGEKWALVVVASAAGFFSPMSANIYFPAIPLLAEDFHVSVSLMNLTVTVYLIFQGVSPMLWAPIADMKGRRPIFLACLLLLSVTCVGLAQVPTNKWWVILILRSIQASGSASTVAICYGVVADIALPAHRGSFLGISGIGMLVAPCIGPVIGGAIAGSLGWRWIFWILGILSGACFVGLLLFLPETLRRVVGNGSTPAPWWDRPLIPIIGPFRLGRKPPAPAEIANTESPGRPRYNPFRFFLQLDVDVMLFANAEVYGVFIAMQASLSLLLQEAYPFLNQTSIGLCFLPMGVGALFSSLMTGRFLDWQYRKDRASWEQERRRLRRMANEDPDAPFTQEDELTFPIERWVLAGRWTSVRR